MAHDLVIKNAMVVDGTGAPPQHADVAVVGGKMKSAKSATPRRVR